MNCKWLNEVECTRENPTDEECICCLLAKIYVRQIRVAESGFP